MSPVEAGSPAVPRLVCAKKEFVEPRVRLQAEHRHPYHELLVVQRGCQLARAGNHELRAGPGEVLFFSRGTPHEEWLIPGDSVLKYTIRFEWDVPLSDVPFHLSDGKGRLLELADWIGSEAPNADTLAPTIPEPLLYGLVGELRRAAQRRGQELVERARQIVRREMGHIRSVEGLALALGMSRSHLSRRFMNEAGHAPSDFLRRERLQRARFLLRNTRMAVKEVADAVGISNEQQMCRMIRRAFGVTTRELRGTASRSPRMAAE